MGRAEKQAPVHHPEHAAGMEGKAVFAVDRAPYTHVPRRKHPAP